MPSHPHGMRARSPACGRRPARRRRSRSWRMPATDLVCRHTEPGHGGVRSSWPASSSGCRRRARRGPGFGDRLAALSLSRRVLPRPSRSRAPSTRMHTRRAWPTSRCSDCLVPFLFGGARRVPRTFRGAGPARGGRRCDAAHALSFAVDRLRAIRPAGADLGAGSPRRGDLRVARRPASVAIFGALALWVPSPATSSSSSSSAALAAATLAFGAAWAAGGSSRRTRWIAIAFTLSPLALAARLPAGARRRRAAASPTAPPAWARPVLTSISVDRLMRGDRRSSRSRRPAGRIDAANAIDPYRLLGVGIVAADPDEPARQHARPIAQARSRARPSKEAALRETDAALDRVRDDQRDRFASPRSTCDSSSTPPSTASSSSTTHGSVIRANDAFCRDGRAGSRHRSPVSPGPPWQQRSTAPTALRQLPHGGQATITRSDGQPLYLESTRLDDPDRSPAQAPARSRRHAPEASPTRRSGRSSSSCRTATRTERVSSAARTRRSNRSATASRATSTTAPCRACPQRRYRSRRRC